MSTKSERSHAAPEDTETSDALPRQRQSLPQDLRLLAVSGRDRGSSVRLGVGTHVIGKATDCALVLSDPLISRHHLELRVTSEAVSVRDLGSRNGSYFGGARFDSIVIGLGTTVTVGDTELKLTTADDGPNMPLSEHDRFGELIGDSPSMRRVFTLLERVAAADGAVLLQGETGTGKDLAAEAIHATSARRGGPFVVCDLAGVPRSLIESELFGHLRGAFTGADREREGAFAQAHGGTLFLDEVGELDMETQPRLLRVLERRQVKPVGSSTYRTVNVRVVAATNRDLLADVQAGRFRRDLYHRLAVVRVELPPLRERPSDIPRLAQHFLRLAAEAAGREPWRVPELALGALSAHNWPGNVRELRNVLEHAASLSSGGTELDPRHLVLDGDGAPHGITNPLVDSSLLFKEAKEHVLESWERDYLRAALDRSGRSVSRTARQVGISRVYLHELMKKHGIAR